MALRDLINPKPYPISTPGAQPTAPAPVVVEDDVAPLEKSLSAGRTQLEQLRTDQTRMGGEAANLTLQIAADTANLVSYRNKQEVFIAEQKVAESKELEKNIKKMLDDERSSPQYKEKERINKELAELGSFVPTEVTAPMLGVLFSVIGATGMLLGGNSKSHAKFAMAAMNGMAEGFGKGREQYNKEQKAAFDTNVKLLQTKLSAIKDGLEDARREAILNKEAADIKVRQTLASNEAQFLQENTNKRGLESTIALVDGQLKNLNRAIQFQTSKATQLAGQLDTKETQLAMRKIESARREAETRIRSQDQERRDRERREDRLSDITRSENFRREMAQSRVENRSGQTQRASQQQFITQRAVNALGGVASAIETIVELPQGSTTGWLPNLQTKDGMFNAIRNQIGRKIAPVDAELMNTTFTGIGRNLAAIESSGLASGLATLANQMQQGTYINAGVDDPYKVAMKLADIKRIATENIQPAIDSGLMTDLQAKAAQDLVKRIEKAIPYNTRDVAVAYREATARTKGKPTVGQSASQVVRPGEGWSDKDEKRLQELEEKARGSQPK
jgi:hypothetical protein